MHNVFHPIGISLVESDAMNECTSEQIDLIASVTRRSQYIVKFSLVHRISKAVSLLFNHFMISSCGWTRESTVIFAQAGA